MCHWPVTVSNHFECEVVTGAIIGEAARDHIGHWVKLRPLGQQSVLHLGVTVDHYGPVWTTAANEAFMANKWPYLSLGAR